MPRIDYDCESHVTLGNQQVSEDCGSGEIQSFASYFRRVLPSRIRQEIVKQISRQNQVPSASTLDSVIRSCLDQTENEWHQARNVQPVENQEWACQSGDNDPTTSWPSNPSTPTPSLNQSLSSTDMALDHSIPRHQNEVVRPSWAWADTFSNEFPEFVSVEPALFSYGEADLPDHSRAALTPCYSFAWDSNSVQWSSEGLDDAINLDQCDS